MKRTQTPTACRHDVIDIFRRECDECYQTFSAPEDLNAQRDEHNADVIEKFKAKRGDLPFQGDAL